MPNVYIPNIASHDYEDAKRFGTLVPLTTGNLDLGNVSKIYRAMEPILCCSSPDDYILISGASVVNVIATAIFSMKHNKLNLLIYRRTGKYVERNLNLNKGESK